MKIKDKPGCRIYPADTEHYEALMWAVPHETCDVVDCWASDYEADNHFDRYGKTKDGRDVELFEDCKGAWYAILIPPDQDEE
jgi:hypothetical protein